MAHFNDLLLPFDIELGAVYGPEFDTDVARMRSGREVRNRTRDAICRGDLSYAPRLQADYAELLKIFYACNGKLHSFRFKDWGDFTCALTEGVVAAIDSTHFQLQKSYAHGSHAELRTIQQPIASGFVLKDGATTLTVTTDYTVDTATGIVTAGGERVAGNLTWSGEFDNAVRFDVDRMPTSWRGFEIQQWSEISIQEVGL